MNKPFASILMITVVVCASVLSFSTNLWASDSDRIKGVADFLMDRASDNYLYMLEMRMKDNKAFKMYLPMTYDQIMNLDLKKVLQSSPAVWEKSIDADLNTLQGRFNKHVKQDISAYLTKSDTEYCDDFINKTKDVSLFIDGKSYQLNFIPFSAPVKDREIITKINDSYTNLVSKLKELFKTLKEVKVNNIEANKIDSSLDEALQSLYQYEDILTSHDYTIKNVKQLTDTSDNIKAFLIKSKDVNRYVEDMNKSDLPMVMRVNSTLLVMDYLVDKHGRELFKNSGDYEIHQEYYTQFKQYALFFAQISDAKSSDEVNSILKSFALPSVSFGVKRKPRENHFLIASYLGIAAGAETTNPNSFSKEIKYYAGLTAPVGIEYSWGLSSKSSISLFASVFDFGSAINAQLYGSSDNIKFNDIIAPGLFVVYGFKDIPLAFGFGYQRGKGIKTENASEQHAMVFITFDMPLFVLF